MVAAVAHLAAQARNNGVKLSVSSSPASQTSNVKKSHLSARQTIHLNDASCCRSSDCATTTTATTTKITATTKSPLVSKQAAKTPFNLATRHTTTRLPITSKTSSCSSSLARHKLRLNHHQSLSQLPTIISATTQQPPKLITHQAINGQTTHTLSSASSLQRLTCAPLSRASPVANQVGKVTSSAAFKCSLINSTRQQQQQQQRHPISARRLASCSSSNSSSGVCGNNTISSRAIAPTHKQLASVPNSLVRQATLYARRQYPKPSSVGPEPEAKIATRRIVTVSQRQALHSSKSAGKFSLTSSNCSLVQTVAKRPKPSPKIDINKRPQGTQASRYSSRTSIGSTTATAARHSATIGCSIGRPVAGSGSGLASNKSRYLAKQQQHRGSCGSTDGSTSSCYSTSLGSDSGDCGRSNSLLSRRLTNRPCISGSIVINRRSKSVDSSGSDQSSSCSVSSGRNESCIVTDGIIINDSDNDITADESDDASNTKFGMNALVAPERTMLGTTPGNAAKKSTNCINNNSVVASVVNDTNPVANNNNCINPLDNKPILTQSDILVKQNANTTNSVFKIFNNDSNTRQPQSQTSNGRAANTSEFTADGMTSLEQDNLFMLDMATTTLTPSGKENFLDQFNLQQVEKIGSTILVEPTKTTTLTTTRTPDSYPNKTTTTTPINQSIMISEDCIQQSLPIDHSGYHKQQLKTNKLGVDNNYEQPLSAPFDLKLDQSSRLLNNSIAGESAIMEAADSSSKLLISSPPQAATVTVTTVKGPLGPHQSSNIEPSSSSSSSLSSSKSSSGPNQIIVDQTNNSIAAGLAIKNIPIRDEPITDFYFVEASPFARGKFATVKRCVNKETKECFAAKCIRKVRRQINIRNEVLLEIEALKLAYLTKHIVKIYEVFETAQEMILVLEMANGGELQRVIDLQEPINEKIVKRMVRQILEGLVHLHDNNIVHLDIKPQNLLLTEQYPDGDIKLCDFGISRRITKDCELREVCGTPDYVAPEILRYDPISLATDMWSLGVLTYVLLSGYSPFGGETKQQTFCNITQAPLDFPNEIFEGISSTAIEFIQRLIVREPSRRLTSREAINHVWLSK